jgi:predicted RNase H-like nuclease (RuvC/YqgF family)
MDRLEDRPDLSLSSSMVSSENNHQNNTSADTAAYKIKATELESKVKQIEVVNASLTEQLSVAQNELTELENKQEVLNNSIGIKVFFTV